MAVCHYLGFTRWTTYEILNTVPMNEHAYETGRAASRTARRTGVLLDCPYPLASPEQRSRARGWWDETINSYINPDRDGR